MLNDLYQTLDPIAFSIGPFTARWYGIAYALGFLLAAAVIYFVGKRWKMRFDLDSICVVIICAMVGVIIGGRLGYVLIYNAPFYAAHPLEVFNFANGGMSFHGGLIGALLAGIVAAKIIKMPYLSLVDVAIIGVPIGLFFGRCANFVNGELWGAPTDLPWGVVFGGSAGSIARHPSQLYEALLEGVVLFIVLYAMSFKKPPFPRGSYLGVFLIGYGLFRFLVEFIRLPDAQIGYLFGDWFTMGQLLSLPLVVIGIILLIYAYRTKRPQAGPYSMGKEEDSHETTVL